MAYRDRTKSEKTDSFDYCIIEVQLRKKGSIGTGQLRLMTVDNHRDTLQFVQDNMNACIGNMVKVRRTEERRTVNPGPARLLTKLEPVSSPLAAANGQFVIDQLSISLKKALLLMVMECYQSDRDKASSVLGITRERLETELYLCGVVR